MKKIKTMYRVLYLSPSPKPPPKTPQKNQFFYLSRYFSGDLLSPTWWGKNPENLKLIDEINFAMGNFKYHPTFSKRLPRIIKIFWNFIFYVFQGCYLHYFKKKYDVIITYGAYTTALAGCLIKVLTGAKLIVEITGFPRAYLFKSEKINITDRINYALSILIASIAINLSDHLHLLCPDQLKGFMIVKNKPKSISHDFTPINTIKPLVELPDKYILLLGFPWYLKGVDILIKAFKIISDEFPEYRLKIVGHCRDKTYFQDLAKGSKKIELCNKGVFHDEAMKIMSKCSLFVLPSRSESMGRALLEAMALKKPIIASKVGGIPHYVKHGINGLLFEPEDVGDLADKMRCILKDKDYALKLAENAYKYVYQYLSEKLYVEHYKKMVENTLN